MTKPKTTIRPASGSDPRTDEFWELRLYVTGRTAKSLTVLSKLKETCESHLEGRYRITVIDLLRHPHRAKTDQVVAIPTVIRALPTPLRRLIGNLSDTQNMLSGLEMPSAV
jgi:circadian clock protein KaiB